VKQDSQLDRMEQAGRIAKSHFESKLLEKQLSGSGRLEAFGKFLTMIGGLATTVVALVGLYLSSEHWLFDSRQARASRDLDRMQRALSQVGEKSPNQRVAGVMALNTFLLAPERDQRDQALLALSNALAVEESPGVRRAIVSCFEGIDTKVVDRAQLNDTVSWLARVSRGLVAEGTLWLKRSSNLYFPPQDGGAEARAHSVADSIIAIIRKGGHPVDLSGTYLAGCDFTNVELDHTKFDDSILAWSDFTGATLHGASFNGADLDKTRFVEADLRNARLTNKKGPRSRPTQDYVSRAFGRAKDQIQIYGPDFSCADLRNADFSSHSLFAVVADDLPELAWLAFPSQFEASNLEGTRFDSVKVYGVHLGANLTLPFPSPRSGGEGFKELWTYTAEISAGPLDKNVSRFSSSLNQMSRAFAGSNWQAASFPEPLLQYLRQDPPPNRPTFFFGRCTPRNAKP
jgi:uncharacterized protein YjbI with pentapeptide repeats